MVVVVVSVSGGLLFFFVFVDATEVMVTYLVMIFILFVVFNILIFTCGKVFI